MKPFVIVRFDADKVYDMVLPREAGGRGVFWATKEAESQAPHYFDGKHPAYFAETEEDAQTLASYLASKNPGSYWVVAKSATSFRSTPGPVAKAIFTDRGMLPSLA